MRPSEVALAAGARQAIDRAVRAAWPREWVAVLGGQRRPAVTCIDRIVSVADADTIDGFAMPPAAFVAATAELARLGCEFLGFAHSHPGGAAAPSVRDRTELWSRCVQLIAGGAGPDAVQLAAYWLDRGACTPLPLRSGTAEATA